ncbi:TPR repeat protein [Devosia sp. UYZn731]|uniref:tetratricopeptide repeat protein n=1 Tax=Devosia sp. UYZn731 TaxID=3156345 RepID=UPI00339B1D75
MRTSISGRAPVTASLVAALGLSWIGAAAAAPVAVVFAPPAIAPQQLCVIQPELSALATKWQAWDGKQLLDSDPEVVLGEIQRLRDGNATLYKSAASAAFALLDHVPDADFQQKLVVDEIRFDMAAGDVATVKSEGLVQKLETSFSALTPRSLFALADIYLAGEAVPADPAKGRAFLLSAAAGGSADALLRAAQMRANGELPEYGLDATTAIAVAFGTILGEIDKDVCSRISRIARYYESGDIVQQDYALAEQWLRLGADLGDPGAAWKVARYHLASERIVKDNDTLVKYLTIAANAQIPPAEVELGEIYQAGSLLPQDLDAAENLYRGAAAGGYRIGNLRLVSLLEDRTSEEGADARLEVALRDLSSFPDAPASALVKLSQVLVKKDGRWGSLAEVRPLLERAVDQKSPDAALMLADIVLTDAREATTIDRAISLLNLAVSEGGKSEAMSRLSEVYMCLVPDAPNLALAASWRESAVAAGNSTMIGDDHATADDDTDLAQAQSMALRGASGRVAQYVDMLRKQNYGDEVIAFWENRMEQDPTAQNMLAKLLVQNGATGDSVKLSINLLEGAVEAGSDAARVTLANLLLTAYVQEPTAQERASALLEEAASHGSGAALERLLELQPDGTKAAVLLQRYQQAIDARGDLDAFLFAASSATNSNERQAYLTKAIDAANCQFSDVIKLARSYASSGDKATAKRWLNIATHLTEGKGWQYASLAQEFALLKDDQYVATVVGLLEQAVQHGQIASLDRLIELRSDPQSSAYDPPKVVTLVKAAVADASPVQLLNLARRIERATPELRNAITQTVDIQAIYRTSAEGGNPTAMRELGKYLQQRATDPKQLTEAMDWMEKAADAKDPEAMLLLAKAYTVGIGRDASLERAVALLEDAADLGSSDAKKMLSAMGPLHTTQ